MGAESHDPPQGGSWLFLPPASLLLSVPMREKRSQAEQHKRQARVMTMSQGGQEVGWEIEAFLGEGHAEQKGQRAEDGASPLCHSPRLFDHGCRCITWVSCLKMYISIMPL